MSIRGKVVSCLKKALLSRGYVVGSVKNQHRATMAGALNAIMERKHPLRTVIDIGASDGRWSEQAMAYLPQCAYLLIEAQDVHEAALRRFCREHSQAQFTLAAAGDGSGQIYFKANRPFGGQASHTPSAEHNITVRMTSVDEEVRSRRLTGPFLLKLDTHGFEVPILQGARETLEQTEIVIMECYNFKIAPQCLLYYEMCEKLRELRFRCIDLVDLRYRPRDGSFWQMDLVFARDEREEFSYNQFK